MVKRLLIDASHAEETRMVVLDGNRIEDFDVEVASRRQIKGNIYLAKVVRVEPSLQAAFVDYGGNRHGFLAFGEIHPDYYQIPVADREKLLALQAEAMREARAEEDALEEGEESGPRGERSEEGMGPSAPAAASHSLPGEQREEEPSAAADAPPLLLPPPAGWGEESGVSAAEAGNHGEDPFSNGEAASFPAESMEEGDPGSVPEMLGGEEDGSDADLIDETRRHQIPLKFLRQYKIQEVIHRRQIMLVQVVKEERGNKGAALTTYISLPGRYCVLMPNALRGGGISRKITSPADRKRLREVIKELGIPEGMALIVRTAGANRPKEDIKRDCEYLLRLWDEIRETTLRSIAPALIYEDASLIKRAIRDIYMRDIDEVIVDGENGFREAREMMRLMTPAHVNKVTLWRDGGMPLFARYQIEQQLEAVFRPVVPLRSGGYIVINQTEALVAIDVNSGRATRERNVEDTALRTNLEAAEEIARQIRLRDLGGLIVIDFIDMDQRRHNLQVERRLKEALKQDRARIQVGSISPFGLLEMSRQRLRPSLVETSLIACPHCGGLGHVRSTESAAVHVLRLVEEEAARRRAAELTVHAAAPVVLYIFNAKRTYLNEIEARFGVRVTFEIDPALIGEQARIERKRAAPPLEARPEPVTPTQVAEALAAEAHAEPPSGETAPAGGGEMGPGGEASLDTAGAEGEKRRRRRRRRRPQRREEAPAATSTPSAQPEGEREDTGEGLFPSSSLSFEPSTGLFAPGSDGAEASAAEERREMPASFAREAEKGEGVREEPGLGENAAPSLPVAEETPLAAPPVPAEGEGAALGEAEETKPARRRRTASRTRRSPRKGSRLSSGESEVSASVTAASPEEARQEETKTQEESKAEASPPPELVGNGKETGTAPFSGFSGSEPAQPFMPHVSETAGREEREGRKMPAPWGEGHTSTEQMAPFAQTHASEETPNAEETEARGPQASVPITPIVVGVTPVPERKRGWWRRS